MQQIWKTYSERVGLDGGLHSCAGVRQFLRDEARVEDRQAHPTWKRSKQQRVNIAMHLIQQRLSLPYESLIRYEASLKTATLQNKHEHLHNQSYNAEEQQDFTVTS